MVDIAQTGPARRSLARMLKQARIESGISYETMKAVKLSSKSAWNRYENGQVRPTLAIVRYACDVFKVEPEQRALLERLAEQADVPTAWEEAVRGQPTTPGFTMYLEMESFATEIQVFGPCVVPGLVQSPAYQREQFEVSPSLTAGAAERLAKVRAGRQDQTIGRAQLTVVIGEEVLHRQVGGAQVMREQVQFLRDLDTRSDVDILVLPFSAGAHPGGRGEFTLLTFSPESKEPPFGYVEGYLAGQYSSDREVIQDLTTRFTLLHSSSVPMKEFAP